MEEQALTNQDIIQIVEEATALAITEYNSLYGEDKEASVDLSVFVLGFAIVTLFGYNALTARQDIPNDIKKKVQEKFSPEYEGVHQTTRSIIANEAEKIGRELTPKEIQKILDQRKIEIADSIANTVNQEVTSQLAEEDGKRYVGAITRMDSRVRPDHVKNNNKYWLASTYRPWSDFGCRCTYVWFNTSEDARQAGFSPL